MRSLFVAAAMAALVALPACSHNPEANPEANPETYPAPALPVPAAPDWPSAKGARDTAAPVAEALADRSRPLPAQHKQSMTSIGMTAPLAYVPMLPHNTERYERRGDNPIHSVSAEPVSTFSADVDTGSYANLRRFLQQGQLPPEDAVRVEEFINAFDYHYPAPRGEHPGTPFSVQTEVVPSPWNSKTHLMRVGIQGWVPRGDMPPSNLVFLVDVSGSMMSGDKLPLLQASLRLLVKQLRPEDRISLVTYAGGVRTVLAPTAGSERASILAAIDELTAGGSTNGADGIRRAYAAAHQGYIKGGLNRILLCTDGDFNVGTVDFEQLRDIVERERVGGVALSTFGFGQGNYNDHLMEQLADAGNGNHGYIDTLKEAQKLFVRNRAATLQTIAKDVKIQVEFNPATVSEYRLIGYENRALAHEDFSNDQVDAGDIGVGHSVTALYEIALVGSGGERLEPLRYQTRQAQAHRAETDELAFVRLRYKQPDGDRSALIEQPVHRSRILAGIDRADESTRWAAAVAAFGQQLRGGKYLDHYGYDELRRLAASSRGEDPYGDRAELLQLIDLAQSLTPQPTGTDAARRDG